MTEDRTPAATHSMLERPLMWATRLVLNQPVAILALALGAAALSLTYAGTRMGFHTSRNELVNPASDYNQLWSDYINEFGDKDDALLVVEGPSRDAVVPVLEELSQVLARDEHLFQAVLHQVDLSKIRSKGLHYLGEAEIQATDHFTARLEPIIQGDWSRLNVGQMVESLQRGLSQLPPEAHGTVEAQQLLLEATRLAEGLLMAFSDRSSYRSPWPMMPQAMAMLSELGSEYLLTNEGRRGIVMLKLADQESDGFERGREAITALRKLIATVNARHPEVKIGLTGVPVMEYDEMRTSSESMTQATILSLVGVACLFLAGLGGIRHPIMAVFALLLGMAWSFGYLTVAVGHLNILSVSFGVLLIGLGIDFGIHYVARYLQVRPKARDAREALLETSSSVGPGILAGALTTALAFFSAGLTSFTGVVELGVIAGGGIVLCVVAALLVLPAMINLWDRRKIGGRIPRPIDVSVAVKPLMRLGAVKWVLGISLVATGLAALGMQHLWYDHNLLNLQPRGLESVELERKLLRDADQSVWYALSIAESREELLERKQKFLQLASVERVEEIVSLLPADHERKQPLIEQIHRRLAYLPERPPRIAVDSPDTLGSQLGVLQQLVGTGQAGLRAQRALEQVRDALRRLPLAECYERLTGFQQQMAGDLLSRLHMLRSISNPEPPKFDDLPLGLVTRFVGKSDRYLLKVYGKGDIWNMDTLAEFVADIRAVDARVTGNPLQAYEASLEMKTSYQEAAVYSLIGIVVILLLDFGSIRDVLLAIMPLTLGMVMTFGLMGWLNLPLNPANMIVLPLILGIGVDDGVHVMHDFRSQKGRFKMNSSTISAVLLTSLTSMVGIGTLMIASHQGLQSLGRVLTLGVTCCLLTSTLTLPALLTWITRNRPEEETPAEPEEPKPLLRGLRLDPAHPQARGPHQQQQQQAWPERITVRPRTTSDF